MTKTNQNETMYAGDTRDIEVAFPVGTNLSGASVKWGLFKGNQRILLKTTGNGVTLGSAMFTIRLDKLDTEGQTGRFYHEAEVTDGLGNVSTVMTGWLTVEPSKV